MSPRILILLLLGPGSGAAQSPPDAIPRDAPSTVQEATAPTGLEVYRARYCGVCHTLDSAETKGLFGPSHDGLATTAARRIADPEYTGSASTIEEYIRESIIDPAVYLVPGYDLSRYRMGAYTMLSEAELDALVRFLSEQR